MDQTAAQSRKWIVLLITTVSVFMSTLDGSIVNIALPVIAREMGVAISSVQWVVTSYLLTISVLLPVIGKLSDLFGKKYIFASGYLVFALGSAMCGLSHALATLVVSRILQAVGASAMMSLSQGIVTGIFPANERGKALGINGTMVAVGSLVGPSLGGMLINAFRWESIFYINIPIGIAGAALAFALIPEIFEKEKEKTFDYAGTGLYAAAILLLFLGLLFLQDGMISVLNLTLMLLLAAVSFAAFFLTERRRIKTGRGVLIDLRMFRIHEFSMGLASAYLNFIAINSTLLFMPFYLQDLLGMSAWQSAMIISFYPVTTAVVAPLSGWLSDKVTYRPLTVIGMSTSTAALFLLSTLKQGTPHQIIILYLVLLGAGVAIFQSPNNSSVMGAVPRQQLGVAGGINALFRTVGMVSGTTFSVLAFSLSTRMSVNSLSSGRVSDPAMFLRGFSLILLIDAGCCLLGALVSLTRAAAVKPRRHTGDEL